MMNKGQRKFPGVLFGESVQLYESPSFKTKYSLNQLAKKYFLKRKKYCNHAQ